MYAGCPSLSFNLSVVAPLYHIIALGLLLSVYLNPLWLLVSVIYLSLVAPICHLIYLWLLLSVI